jgi:hypothetical protein
MKPQVCWAGLQQPLNGVAMPGKSGQLGSGVAGSVHSVLKLIAALLEPQTSCPFFTKQHGITHGFIAKPVGAAQLCPPQVVGPVDASSVHVIIIIGSTAPASVAL